MWSTGSLEEEFERDSKGLDQKYGVYNGADKCLPLSNTEDEFLDPVAFRDTSEILLFPQERILEPKRSLNSLKSFSSFSRTKGLEDILGNSITNLVNKVLYEKSVRPLTVESWTFSNYQNMSSLIIG